MYSYNVKLRPAKAKETRVPRRLPPSYRGPSLEELQKTPELWANVSMWDLSEERIQNRIHHMASELVKRYQNEDICLVPVLKGAYVFFAQLMQRLTTNGNPVLSKGVVYEPVSCRSYEDDQPGKLDFRKYDLTPEIIEGRVVIVLDDILDSGHTGFEVLHAIQDMGCPKDVRAMFLLRKMGRQLPEFDISAKILDIGFDIEDAFVVGYGLDFRDRFRELTNIYVPFDLDDMKSKIDLYPCPKSKRRQTTDHDLSGIGGSVD